MYRHRLAIAAAVVALPFTLTACSSGGTGDTLGQKAPGGAALDKSSSEFCKAYQLANGDKFALDTDRPAKSPDVIEQEWRAAAGKAPGDLTSDFQIESAFEISMIEGHDVEKTDPDQKQIAASAHVSAWLFEHCPQSESASSSD